MDLKQEMKERTERIFLEEIKVRLAHAYSGSKKVFFFENTDDIETYKIWIERTGIKVDYFPYPMKGKDKCLKLYDYFHNQEAYEKSYFFIDKDFDGSKNYEKRNNLFITDRYSIENYLFDPAMVIEYLKAEFKCYEPRNFSNLESLKELYQTNLNAFLSLLGELNYQIFLARSLNIDVKISENKRLKEIIKIELEKCVLKNVDILTKMLDEDINKRTIGVNTETLKSDFDQLMPINSYRGKFIQFFFVEWLNILKECHNTNPGMYFFSGKAKFDPNNIDLYKYANYSPIPINLKNFLQQVA